MAKEGREKDGSNMKKREITYSTRTDSLPVLCYATMSIYNVTLVILSQHIKATCILIIPRIMLKRMDSRHSHYSCPLSPSSTSIYHLLLNLPISYLWTIFFKKAFIYEQEFLHLLPLGIWLFALVSSVWTVRQLGAVAIHFSVFGFITWDVSIWLSFCFVFSLFKFYLEFSLAWHLSGWFHHPYADLTFHIILQCTLHYRHIIQKISCRTFMHKICTMDLHTGASL